MDFPKKQQQCLIPKYLLDYATELQDSHPDPTAEWSGGSGGSPIEAGTGIEITGDETKTISVDETVVAMKTDIPDVSDFITEDEVDTKLEDYELKADAFSGSYNDLTDKPDLSVYAESADLGDCAYLDEDELSIAYSQITGTPTIPTKTSELTNDSGYITGVTWNDVTGKPTFATVATSGDYDDLIDKPDLSVYELKTEAFSGNYNDLTNKPDLSVYALSSSLANVATTGDYNDLTNKPTIPTVNNNTITITQGGVTKGTFTLNQSSDSTIALDGGSTPSNMVTTDTDQTITGVKTFSSGPFVNKLYLPYYSNPLYGYSNAIYAQFINDNTYNPILEISKTTKQVTIGHSTAELTFRSTNRPTYGGTDIALTSDIPTVPTVVDTVANGNMNAVTSNAVYDVVGDIETLLAAL